MKCINIEALAPVTIFNIKLLKQNVWPLTFVVIQVMGWVGTANPQRRWEEAQESQRLERWADGSGRALWGWGPAQLPLFPPLICIVLKEKIQNQFF